MPVVLSTRVQHPASSIQSFAMRFRVNLDTFCGPLDLLLYLVRKHEVDLLDLPIATVTDQFLEFVAVLERIDVTAVGDFIEMASTLIEIKSRSVLPGEEEIEEPFDDPRQELVRRLLEYKRYRDAASILEERGREWRDRFPRLADGPMPRVPTPDQQPIREVELWDLVSAFGRVLQERSAVADPESIRYDETPIHVFMQQIDARLRRERRVGFTTLIAAATHRSTLVGMFLAVLELVRHQHARADQPEIFGEIWLEPGPVLLPEDVSALMQDA